MRNVHRETRTHTYQTAQNRENINRNKHLFSHVSYQQKLGKYFSETEKETNIYSDKN